jgi:excisionase family DNA binding protein
MTNASIEETQYLTIKEFAAKVDYSERHIRRLIKGGNVQACRSEGRRKWLIPESEVSRLRGEASLTPPGEVAEKQIRKEVSLVTAKRIEQHFDHLADIAKGLLSGNLDNVTAKSTKTGDIFEYTFWEGTVGQGIARKQLSEMLERNIESFYEQPNDTYDLDYFLYHLVAEYPEVQSKGFNNFAKKNPYELVEMLRLLVRRKTFKGTCPVCKDW